MSPYKQCIVLMLNLYDFTLEILTKIYRYNPSLSKI
jgi:hypothetical protein